MLPEVPEAFDCIRLRGDFLLIELIELEILFGDKKTTLRRICSNDWCSMPEEGIARSELLLGTPWEDTFAD